MKTGTRALLAVGITCVLGFSFVLWVTFLYPVVENTVPVWVDFILFYMIIVLGWLIMTVGLSGFSWNSFKVGIVGSVLFGAIDLFCPSYAVDINGNVAVGEAAGYKGSIDYFLGYYLNMFGIHGILVFIIVYFLIPILTLILMLLILAPRQFIATIKKG